MTLPACRFPDEADPTPLNGDATSDRAAASAFGRPRTLRSSRRAGPAGPAARRVRVALYSHDTMGFGHVRRNILIAQALAASPLRAEVLLLSGIREAGAFALPPGVDSVTLPAYHKDGEGRYHPRALGDDIQRLVDLRAAVLRAALRRFAPDVLIVDNVPRGAMGELDKVLPELRARHGTRCVLGLRDILDEPEAVQRQWWRQRNHEAVRRHYDAVWVYGDERLSDPVREYALGADIGARLQHVGYLDQRRRLALSPTAMPPPDAPYALCVVGGGQDGARLTHAFAAACRPAGWHGVIVAGSMMPPQALQALHEAAGQQADLRVLDFVAEPLPLMRDARCVVAMGGYNTITELLCLEQRALIVPRTRPRREQLIRAERMAALGWLQMLHPDGLTPGALTTWMASEASGAAACATSDPRPVQTQGTAFRTLPRTAADPALQPVSPGPAAAQPPGVPPGPTAPLDLGGLVRIPALLADLLGTRPGTAREHARPAAPSLPPALPAAPGPASDGAHPGLPALHAHPRSPRSLEAAHVPS
jgi:predicted glycosyltransferase